MKKRPSDDTFYHDFLVWMIGVLKVFVLSVYFIINWAIWAVSLELIGSIIETWPLIWTRSEAFAGNGGLPFCAFATCNLVALPILLAYGLLKLKQLRLNIYVVGLLWSLVFLALNRETEKYAHAITGMFAVNTIVATLIFRAWLIEALAYKHKSPE